MNKETYYQKKIKNLENEISELSIMYADERETTREMNETIKIHLETIERMKGKIEVLKDVILLKMN